MQLLLLCLLVFFTCSCGQKKNENNRIQIVRQKDSSINRSLPATSYLAIKEQIANRKKELATRYLQVIQSDQKEINEEIKYCWINGISNDLYKHWADTPWDFNGTTREPKQGTIACGYFVTTLLLDMGMQFNRIKLSTCAASEMMHKLVPHQEIKKLNSLTYDQFCAFISSEGKGVYIIGLDYHVGFIVNDGQNCWFVHANYINKQGVIKEPIQYSQALKASNTKWLISLTNDKDFIICWLKAKN